MGKQILTLTDIGGGVRQDLTNEIMPDNAWSLIQNYEYDIDGNLISRNGQSKYNSAAIAGTLDNGIRFYRPSSGAKSLIVSAFISGRTALYVGNDSAGTFAEITTNNLTANLPVNFAVFRDTLLITNGTNTIQYYTTGTGKSPCVYSDNDRKGKYIAVADYRVWLAGDPSYPNRVWVSDLGFWATGAGTDCSFPNDNYIDIPAEENDFITGLASYQDDIYVFRTKDIWYIAGNTPATFTMRKIIDTAGAVSQKAICVFPQGVCFADQSTIWIFDGTQLLDIGKLIKTTLSTGSLTTAAIGYYSAKKQLYISFRNASADTYNTMSAVYDLDDGRMVLFSNTGAKAFVCNMGTADNEYFYRLAPNTTAPDQGFVFRIDVPATYQDYGSNYACYLYSKHFSFGDHDVPKRLKQIWFNLGSTTDTTPITISVSVDRGQGTITGGSYTLQGFSHWGSFVYGKDSYGGGNYHYASLPFPAFSNGREFQLRFTKSNNYQVKLFSYKLEMKDRPIRRRS